MSHTGLDNRHRNKDGTIEKKHGNTLNKHLSPPIPQFSDDTTLEEMRQITGKTSLEDVRHAARHLPKE